jgi:hypothetical protein
MANVPPPAPPGPSPLPPPPAPPGANAPSAELLAAINAALLQGGNANPVVLEQLAMQLERVSPNAPEIGALRALAAQIRAAQPAVSGMPRVGVYDWSRVIPQTPRNIVRRWPGFSQVTPGARFMPWLPVQIDLVGRTRRTFVG